MKERCRLPQHRHGWDVEPGGRHRRPGDVHLHFLGADHFSFRDRVRLEDGDVMAVAFEGFGRPLRNPVRIDRSRPAAVSVTAL